MQILALPVGHFEANCYLVWEQAAAMVIDPGGQPDAILAALGGRGLSVAHILLTHAHFDHFLAVPALHEATGAPVWLHSLDVDGIRLNRKSSPFSMPGFTPPADLRTLEDGSVIKAGDLAMAVRHTPGHSPGSCCFVCQNAIFSGDTLFDGDIGRVDLPGGSARAMRRTMEAIAGWTGGYDVYPGHGGSTTLSREQRRNPYLQPPYDYNL
ncbi:MAG: MBL fold metallo-hydrolase [Oscillospiraceae bacterium]|nr:MBL fold metallo-hydrolase [Oscillospiraceae bacterium]